MVKNYTGLILPPAVVNLNSTLPLFECACSVGNFPREVPKRPPNGRKVRDFAGVIQSFLSLNKK